MIKKLLFLGLLSCVFGTLQAIVAVGDTADSATTFQFSVGSAIYDQTAQRLWTLSGQDISLLSTNAQAYGISYTGFIPVDGSLDLTLTSYPYVSTQAVITTTDNDGNLAPLGNSVANPLLGQAYSAVSFVGTHLTVVNTLSPRFIYLIQSVLFDDGASFGTTSAAGTSIINLLDLGLLHEAKAIAGSGLGVLFVAQAQGTFGTDSSDILFAATSTTPVVTNGQTITYTTLAKQAEQTVALTTPVLTAGGNNLSTIGTLIALYPSPITALQMYVGLDVSASVGAGSQAVGLFAAKANPKTESTAPSVTFSSVLPDLVASAGLQTPVSASANRRVAVSNITTTTTSTGLSYFITGRYDGIGRQSVYAMPMVTMADNSSDNGKIARFDSIAQTFKIIGSTYRVQGFNEVIDDANEINISGVAAVTTRLQVGAGPVPLNTGQFINQLVAQGDAVYITIQTPFAVGSTPGMFKSQALFDAQGRIMSWSPWQRVAGTDDQMLFAIKNRTTDATMYVSGATSDTITQTTWNNTTSQTSFIAAVGSAMQKDNGGVQGLVSVSNNTTDLAGFPLLVATGNQAVVIGQTGSMSGGNIIIDSPQNVITINDSLNLNIGSVVTATFANQSGVDNNWLFMGGDNGLAVLSNDMTGIGFNGQLTSLASLTASGMSCKILGNFKFVKKIASDANFLYVMTLDGVYRIALAANKFTLISPEALDAQTVVFASTIDRYASCTDMLVDNNLMLLGTTSGLYSLNVSGGLPATPVSISIPGGLSTVSRMVTISNNVNFYQKFYVSSNLYVLSINYGVQQARLNRFTITNGTITAIEDQLLEGQNGPLLIFDYMSNNIFIDGSLGFATSYRIGSIPPALKYMEYTLQAGNSSTQTLLKYHTANVSIASVLSSLGITTVARDYASGCLMLAADFGLLTDS